MIVYFSYSPGLAGGVWKIHYHTPPVQPGEYGKVIRQPEKEWHTSNMRDVPWAYSLRSLTALGTSLGEGKPRLSLPLVGGIYQAPTKSLSSQEIFEDCSGTHPLFYNHCRFYHYSGRNVISCMSQVRFFHIAPRAGWPFVWFNIDIRFEYTLIPLQKQEECYCQKLFSYPF